ncbi:MAG: hypothetical protein MRJ92_13085 [Nitrospira sp.]|nr:hypothetical protein [Nitrospira sp.]
MRSTNVMAQWNLERAARRSTGSAPAVPMSWPVISERVRVTPDEPDLASDRGARMVTGLIG